jgi:hypothetical protein
MWAFLGCQARSPLAQPLAVDIRAVPSAHSLRFELWLDQVGEPELVCVARGDPEEVHTRQGLGERHWHSLSLQGLLADSVYDCTVRVQGQRGRWEGSASTTSPDPELPELLLELDRGDGHGGYLVFNHWQGGEPTDRVVVVDAHGRVRWSWTLPEEALPDVDVSWVPDEQAFLVGGGSGFVPRLVTLEGEISWLSAGPERKGWYHHHSERLPDGRVLSLLTARSLYPGVGRFEGVALEAREPHTDAVSFLWDGQEAVLQGALPPPTAPDQDVWHANSATWLEDEQGPAIYVSFKYLSRIVRLDRLTGQLGWQLGLGGDFVLQDGEAQWFSGQHAPEWQGTDRVLLYDNGSRETLRSRVLELEVDIPSRTASVSWSWTEEGWFEPLYGDVDQLASGHVLVTMGHSAGLPSTQERRSTLLELDPTSGEQVWRLSLQGERDGVYRAEPISGCDLFHNQKYCEELAP